MQRNKPYKIETYNDAVAELRTYLRLITDAKELKAKVEQYRERYSYGLNAQCYDRERVQGGAAHDKMVETVLIWADLQVEAEQKLVEAERVLMAIKSKIDRLPPLERDVLTYYYLKGYDNIGVGNIMGYSSFYITEIKQSALSKYSKL